MRGRETGLAGQHLVERLGQFAAHRRRLADADADLIVDAPLIENLAGTVEDERFRRAASAEAIGDDVGGILEHGEGDAVLLGMSGDAGRRVLCCWR